MGVVETEVLDERGKHVVLGQQCVAVSSGGDAAGLGQGTMTELSYMFCGKVPLPLPQMP